MHSQYLGTQDNSWIRNLVHSGSNGLFLAWVYTALTIGFHIPACFWNVWQFLIPTIKPSQFKPSKLIFMSLLWNMCFLGEREAQVDGVGKILQMTWWLSSLISTTNCSLHHSGQRELHVKWKKKKKYIERSIVSVNCLSLFVLLWQKHLRWSGFNNKVAKKFNVKALADWYVSSSHVLTWWRGRESSLQLLL